MHVALSPALYPGFFIGSFDRSEHLNSDRQEGSPSTFREPTNGSSFERSGLDSLIWHSRFNDSTSTLRVMAVCQSLERCRGRTVCSSIHTRLRDSQIVYTPGPTNVYIAPKSLPRTAYQRPTIKRRSIRSCHSIVRRPIRLTHVIGASSRAASFMMVRFTRL
jgi:hypothetical protein